jgi:hypothetical protein
MVMLLSLSVFALAGCGDDDPAAPGGGGNNSGDDFDQATAVTQAQVASPQAVALVESIQGMALGVGNKNYAYNTANQRWEYDYSWSQAGYEYDWFYTVQYLDGAGNPQQDADGAASIRHTMDGSGEYSLTQSGTSLDYDFTYIYDMTVSGLGGSTYTMNGTGSTVIDYTYSYQGTTQSADYVMNWSTLDPGITVPENGCPSGTIRYDMDPYRLDVVFNGTGTATSTLYDGSGNTVAAGGGTHQVGCVDAR